MPRADGAGSGTIGTGVLVGAGNATITNFGTVKGGSVGINFSGSGTVNSTGKVFNGDAAETTALISGSFTGISATGSVTVTNFGSIKATAGVGVFMGQGGQLINGGTANTTATISGSGTSGIGARVESGKAVITNFGTVTGAGSVGILFSVGPSSAATGTVVNAGRISNGAGAAGTAIQFGTGDDRLVLRPGSSLIGKVVGGAGTNTLELADGGAATTGAIGTAFTDFGTVVVDTGANWTLADKNTTSKITNRGTLALATGATLQVTGLVDAASSGVFLLQDASTLEVGLCG